MEIVYKIIFWALVIHIVYCLIFQFYALAAFELLIFIIAFTKIEIP